MPCIDVLFIAENRTRLMKVEKFWVPEIYTGRVYARLEGTRLLAELSLTNPAGGWKVYPD